MLRMLSQRGTMVTTQSQATRILGIRVLLLVAEGTAASVKSADNVVLIEKAMKADLWATTEAAAKLVAIMAMAEADLRATVEESVLQAKSLQTAAKADLRTTAPLPLTADHLGVVQEDTDHKCGEDDKN